MDPLTLGAILVALISAAGGYATSRRASRPAQITAESSTATALLASYDAFSDRLQEEVKRVGSDCERRIAELERQHREERAEWKVEKAELIERIDELGSIVYALKNRPPESLDRQDDR